jgi:hypothetical protein
MPKKTRRAVATSNGIAEDEPSAPTRMGRPPLPFKRVQTSVGLRPDHLDNLRLAAWLRDVTIAQILDELLDDWSKRNEDAFRQAKEARQAVTKLR